KRKATSMQRGYNAGGHDYPFALDLPVKAALKPINYGLIKTLGIKRITKDRMRDAPCKRIGDTSGYGKIHIRNPHRCYIRCTKISPTPIKFYGCSSFALNRFIKVKFHHRPSFL